jgi:Ion channel
MTSSPDSRARRESHRRATRAGDANAHRVIDRLGSGFFANNATATPSHCLYFSFTTLTNVGYGDFTAASNLGHTLSVGQALLGQIYLVTIVSVLVSNLGRPRRWETTGSS